MHQYATLEDTVYMGFGANLTTGAAGDGASPLFDVRLGGAAAGAAPVLSGTPTLLTHANYSDGCYEVAIAATAGNGFAAGNTYLVFVTLTIDSVTPAAMIGSFRLAPVPANATQISGDATAADNAEAFFDGTGYAGTNNVIPTVTNTAQLAGAVTVVLTDASSDAVIADAVWNAATATYGGAGSYGLLVETDLDATISSRLASASYTAPTNLTAAQIATGVWQDATAGDFTAASSIGKALYVDNVVPGGTGGHFIAGTNAATTITTALTTTFTGNLTGTIGGLTAAALADFFDTDSGTTYGAAVAGSVVKEIADNAGGGTPPTPGEIADAVWDEDATAHQTQGTFGQAIGDPGADADTIWALVNTNLDATVSSRLASAGYTVPPTTAENADKLLGRNVAGGADGTRTVSEALYVLRNKTAIAAGTLTVYGTDDATPAFTAAITTAVGNPIDSIDPT